MLGSAYIGHVWLVDPLSYQLHRPLTTLNHFKRTFRYSSPDQEGMAEAVLFNIAEGILRKLGSLALQEIGLLWGVKDELAKLNNTVSAIKALLLDAEERQVKSHEVKDWLGKLKDAVYDADDLLDDFSTTALQRKVKTQNKMAKEVSLFFSSSNQLAFSRKMCHKVKAIRERLDGIAVDRTKFHFTDRPVETRAELREREQTHSFVRLEEVVGRDDDKKAIVELLLLDSDVQENVSIVPIVGIGGLGKTTLAQLVYNDEKVKTHFELKMWVCVSDVFDVKLIAEKLLESATDKNIESSGIDRLQNHLRKEIDGKRYLLVLDDIWNDNREKWLKLENLLMGGARGSKIIVTTRSELVAKITAPVVSPYFLKGLPENTSWSLFKQMALKPGQDLEDSSQVEIGKKIVEKCAGVPLAIRTLGSLLYSKDTECEWLSFKNNELSKITQNENDILPILRLSYDHLPSYLKHCFAYCSLFPKDYDIDKWTVVNLWMAQGFVQSSSRDQSLEDVGDQYFMDLLRRSFFQDVIIDEWGNVTGCKMHDLMHDLAQLVAGIETSLADSDAKCINERIRHVSFDSYLDSSWVIPTPLLEANRLRTFLLPVRPIYRGRLNSATFETIISSFGYLRVLDLHNTWVEVVPSSIGKLKHLRYLDLSQNEGIKKLPNSITKLQNLQTMKLCYCKKLEELPRDLRKLVSLRHLEIDQCVGLLHMPSGLGQLTSLQTLTRFVVGKDSTFSKLIGGLSELKGLDNLRGELTIAKFGCLKNSALESKEANLNGKQHLTALTLEWKQAADDGENNQDDKMFLEGLQPHPNLKELHIHRYKGGRFPSWMMVDMSRFLPNLLEITIWRCYGCRDLPLFGQLPMLEVLRLEEVTALEYVDNGSEESSLSYSVSSSSSSWRGNMVKGGASGGGRESAAFFPSLKEFRLFASRNLMGWWKDKKDDYRTATTTAAAASMEEQQRLLPSFPCLSTLTIGHCPKLTYMPLHPNLEELYLKNVSEELLRQMMMAAPAIPITTAATSSSSVSSSSSVLSKLKSLHIDSIEDLAFLPEEGMQSLTSLERFCIESCPRLLHLPGEGLRGLTSLRILSISGCGSLMYLPQGMQHLTALEELEIRECRELDLSYSEEDYGMRLQGLRSLRSLTIEDIPKIVSLPEDLQHVTTLQDIRIKSCSGLITLPEWICNLTLLRQIEISDCPKLTSPPEGTLHYLTTLQRLGISRCPQLLEICQKETEMI